MPGGPGVGTRPNRPVTELPPHLATLVEDVTFDRKEFLPKN
jgi:hypothetical protein